METSDCESDVRKWLTVVLVEENLKDFSVKITGNSEKGDGYIGDIIFVVVQGTDKQDKSKEYNLVLKCSKSSAALLESMPAFRKSFVREAYLYENVFPLFKEFQLKKGFETPFDSVPRCYGVYSDEFRHVIVLENLKNIGYDLWPKGEPLTREAINVITKNYAKFHAVSIALKQQEPKKFQKLIEDLDEDMLKVFFDSSDFLGMFTDTIKEAYEMLEGDVEKDILEKWLKLEDVVFTFFFETTPDIEDLQVINHGDCWVNNFLYKFENEDKTIISKVAMLDWQISKFTSPVTDLSYFLFSGISKEDIADMDTILKDYYDHFCNFLTKLGSTYAHNYPIEKFFDDWKKYAKYGLFLCILPIKTLYSEKEDLPDMAEAANSGIDISKSFKFETRDKSGFKNRVRPIVEYAVKNQLTE